MNTTHSTKSITLEPNQGIPPRLLFMMAAVSGLTVANLYYNQPLLEDIRKDLHVNEVQANLITFVTQVGYALGLLLVVPLADMWSRRKIAATSMICAALMSVTIALTTHVQVLWASSLILGVCSVIPQMFVPMARLYSLPKNQSRNMGYVLSGLLSGVLGARVVSGYIGDWFGWRTMFFVAAVIMLICLMVSLQMLPRMRPTYQGKFTGLMHSILTIYKEHPLIRLYSIRAAFAFGSMMCVWSCMAFHLAGSPFYAGSEAVGMLGLCGMAGAMAASGIGRFIPRFGIMRISFMGSLLQLCAWGVAWCFANSYLGLIATIILVDIGAQCHQLSNQSGCLAQTPRATNRSNTIFMFHLFVGGSLGTLCAGFAWNALQWTGVCLAGLAFALVSLSITLIIKK